MPLPGIIICVVCAIAAYIAGSRIVMNPVTVFCSVWAVVLFLSGLHLYTMYLPSDHTYLMITSGIVCFVLGCLVYQTFAGMYSLTAGGRPISGFHSRQEDVLRYRLTYVLLILSIAVALRNLAGVAASLNSFSLSSVQTLLQSGDYENGLSPVMKALSILVVQPVGFAVPAVVAVDWWKGRKDRVLLLLAVIYMLLRMLSSANRTALILFFLYLIVVPIVGSYGGVREERRKMVRLAAPLIAVGIIAFVLMSLSRGASLRTLYLDFAMAPEMFEIWAGKIDEAMVRGNGLTGIFGWVYALFYVIKNASLNLIPMPELVQTLYDWIQLTDTKWVWPGESIRANAYVSIFWSFYVDGRWMGIIVEMFLFGIFAAAAYRRATILYTRKGMALYCIMFYALAFSFVRYQFSLSKVALAVFYIAFVLYRREPSYE
ncbi:MAG: oligosaccharide repeat unit polymerase [Lachnospiraceae bacterium]|nr:oligosaccharide repeat unit polymerase [Clostridiales bacterium]MCC8081752.1 oligosaccharide repeat unit polymerase [Lachnospiraceae bacterium]